MTALHPTELAGTDEEGAIITPAHTAEGAEVQGARRCQGVTSGGEPCQAPPDFVGPSGFCYTHDPLQADARRRAQQLGGRTTALKFRAKRLEPGELGALDTPSDAQRWCRIAATAVAEGRLSSAQGQTIRSLVAEWLRGRDLLVRETKLANLERKVAAMNRSDAR